MLSKEDKARIEILLRNVFAVDTEAGYRLRYHVTRALACPNYVEIIDFDIYSTLVRVFVWALTPEGYKYWRNICNLQKMFGLSLHDLDKYEEEQVCLQLKTLT